ncbi:hypothetical protein PCASD_22314 [Puccinia coronata f. sp. avenae]|uniref:Uncharacterized protein n=1 Tax=Puccinia coronata f. sp. avenae TaxID=200324 RepID=A0A2N5TW35_9BASI|nr:hypothetical protein PCASD_22314 [Puccinia coronata f. sp. avenae]
MAILPVLFKGLASIKLAKQREANNICSTSVPELGWLNELELLPVAVSAATKATSSSSSSHSPANVSSVLTAKISASSSPISWTGSLACIIHPRLSASLRNQIQDLVNAAIDGQKSQRSESPDAKLHLQWLKSRAALSSVYLSEIALAVHQASDYLLVRVVSPMPDVKLLESVSAKTSDKALALIKTSPDQLLTTLRNTAVPIPGPADCFFLTYQKNATVIAIALGSL